MTRSDPRFEVPPEYADVYEKAFRSASGRSGGREDDHDTGPGGRPPRRGGWPVRTAVVLLVVVVVGLTAFLVGRSSTGRDDSPQSSGTPTAGASTTPSSPPVTSATGPVDPVRATSTCQPPAVSGTDGRAISFAPGNTLDDKRATSWACRGVAVGEELVLTLPPGRTVTSVGLLPTTEVAGVGVNQVMAVDWTFGDGATYRQDLVGGAVAQIRSVGADTSRTVRLRLTDVAPGSADLTGVASVYLFGPAR